MGKLLMLDLDGTVRRPKSGQTFINHPEDQEIIPAAALAVQQYAANGWQIFGITNQGGVAAGYKTFIQCLDEQFYTMSLLPQINQILFCPDDGKTCWEVRAKPSKWKSWGSRQGNSFRIDEIKGWQDFEHVAGLGGKYRKPDPGMLRYALWPEGVAPKQCLYVGDRPEDEAAANAAGVPFFSAADWWLEGVSCEHRTSRGGGQ
jgi:D-glycero-D-manno-heptose 1,7-bisphosphate phosphatase